MLSFVHRAIVLREPGTFRLYQQTLLCPRTGATRHELLSRFFNNGAAVNLSHVITEVARLGLAPAWDHLVVSEALRAAHQGLITHGSLNLYGESLAHAEILTALVELAATGSWSIELLEYDDSLLVPAVQESLKRLASEGLRLVVDDFGTANSARILRELRHLVQGVKIAAELLWLDDGQVSRLCPGLIVGLQGQGFAVTVEGVETPEQVMWLRNAGADWLQGYAIHRPAPVWSEDAPAALFIKTVQSA